MPKWALANLMDLYLYPRHFEPLFRGFFGEAARFRSRRNVEFRPAFLLVMPNTHSKHRCRRVSPLCGISDVKTAGKPPHSRTKPRRIGDAGARESKTPAAQCSGWSFICWLSAGHQFLVSSPSCPCGLRGCPGRAAREMSARSECGSDRMQRVHSRADGATPGDSAHV